MLSLLKVKAEMVGDHTSDYSALDLDSNPASSPSRPAGLGQVTLPQFAPLWNKDNHSSYFVPWLYLPPPPLPISCIDWAPALSQGTSGERGKGIRQENIFGEWQQVQCGLSSIEEKVRRAKDQGKRVLNASGKGAKPYLRSNGGFEGLHARGDTILMNNYCVLIPG